MRERSSGERRSLVSEEKVAFRALKRKIKKLEKSLKKVLTKRRESDILFELSEKQAARTLKIKQRYE